MTTWSATYIDVLRVIYGRRIMLYKLQSISGLL